MTPRFTCATRRPGNQQAPGLALTQTDAAPPLRAAARCSTAPGDWQTAGRRTWGGPYQARHVVRAALAQLLALNPLAGQHAPRGVLRVRARHHHLPAARAPVTIRQPPQKRPSGLARLARILLGALARARTLCGRPPGMRGARSGLRSLRVRRRLSPRWLCSGLAASLSARTRLRQVVADRRGEQRGVVALVDVVQLLEKAGGPLVDQRDDVRLDLRVAPQKDAEFPVDGGALCGKERKSM